jgi:phage repressor protein C with HTH and peptisase S24 domain
MYPFIENGDFVLIKVQNQYNPEDQVLVVNDGRPKIKKVIHENENIVLRSFNPEYKDFVVEKDVDNHVVGIVKARFSKDTFIV